MLGWNDLLLCGCAPHHNIVGRDRQHTRLAALEWNLQGYNNSLVLVKTYKLQGSMLTCGFCVNSVWRMFDELCNNLVTVSVTGACTTAVYTTCHDSDYRHEYAEQLTFAGKRRCCLCCATIWLIICTVLCDVIFPGVVAAHTSKWWVEPGGSTDFCWRDFEPTTL